MIVTIAVYCPLCNEEHCGQDGINRLIDIGVTVIQPREFKTVDGPPPVSSYCVPDDLSHYCIVQFETDNDPGTLEIVGSDFAVFREHDYPESEWVKILIGSNN